MLLREGGKVADESDRLSMLIIYEGILGGFVGVIVTMTCDCFYVSHQV